jgi:hypothetical protein
MGPVTDQGIEDTSRAITASPSRKCLSNKTFGK